jgi:4'-phosphopantetheinyl transferase
MPAECIRLYIGLLDAVDSPQAYEACYATLSTAEASRAARFVFERHRRQYIFAHGLLRAALSRFLPDVQPSDWCFAANRYGRPFVATPAVGRAVHFSLSHTDGCVCCVVSSHEAVAVDVEEIRERPLLFETASSNFSAEEIDALRALQSLEFVDRFFKYWTLKEAYVKARGTGINLPLNQFTMLISSNQRIGISFAPGMADDSRRWLFMSDCPSPKHRLAVADGSGRTGGLPIVVQPWPLP